MLVIKVPVKLSQMQEERVRRQVADTLPLNGAKCLVLHSGMDIAVISEYLPNPATACEAAPS